MSALGDASWETTHFLDLEAGEVLMFTNDDLHYVDEVPDEPLPEWQQEQVKNAGQ